jgi:methionine-rich copper-binding protein CopC
MAVTTVPGANASELVGKPDRPLTPGVYRATWTAAGEDDGHRMSGNISFTVK